ncbi:MAG: tol-pal system protein YbgF [Rhizobiales bacterium]|nr:tol-pal system protein YbgF [Hyphomicrobiales bacterium]
MVRRGVAALFVAGCALAGAAHAQMRPPGAVPGGAPDFAQGQYAQPGDAAGVAVRIDRLENQLRAVNGQLEQLQHRNRQLEEQVRKFQQDVDFRFQEQAGGRKPATPAPAPQKRSEADAPGAVIAAAPLPGPTPVAGAGVATPQSGAAPRAGRSDVFDPSLAPNAPGAPRPLGQTAPSAPLTASPTGPLGGPAPPPVVASAGPIPRAPTGAVQNPDGPIIDEPVAGADAPLDLANPGGRAPRVIPGVGPQGATPANGPATTAALPATGPRAEYDAALGAFRAGQYEQAEGALKGFLRSNPRDRMAADATYYLGETYFQRGRHREAAEQYLKLSTDHAKSARAPDGLLRLGMSLQAMGAGEQACATFGEIPRKYPAASNAVRGAEREMKKAGC